jgi:hypothetical protein
MAAPLNKSTKKISSLFSLATPRDDSGSVLSQSSTSPNLHESSQDVPAADPGSPARLSKSASIPNIFGHKTNTAISSRGPMPPPISTDPLSPLAPPPTLVNHGSPRPASSHGSMRSKHSSRAGSREGSRSRPSTPSTMAPPGGANSPIARTQLTPRELKVLKRHNWLPKRPGLDVEDVGNHEPKAWIAGLKEHVPYDLLPVFQGERVLSVNTSPRA